MIKKIFTIGFNVDTFLLISIIGVAIGISTALLAPRGNISSSHSSSLPDQREEIQDGSTITAPERGGSDLIFVNGKPMTLEEAEKFLPENERPNVDEYGNPLFKDKPLKKPAGSVGSQADDSGLDEKTVNQSGSSVSPAQNFPSDAQRRKYDYIDEEIWEILRQYAREDAQAELDGKGCDLHFEGITIPWGLWNAVAHPDHRGQVPDVYRKTCTLD